MLPRSQRFASGSIAQSFSSLTEYPHPAYLQGQTPLTAPVLFFGAPWYRPGAFRDQQLVNDSVLTDTLPEGIPVLALQTDEWARRVVLPDNAFHWRMQAGPGNLKITLKRAHQQFTKMVYQQFNRMPSNVAVPSHLGLNTWMYRTNGEAMYRDTLHAILLASGKDPPFPFKQPWALPAPFSVRSLASYADDTIPNSGVCSAGSVALGHEWATWFPTKWKISK